jgi:NDP-sugar pyrophosphorylase family protein
LTTPKPLLPVQGQPILEWTLRALPRSVERVVVVTHYLAEQVEAYLAMQPYFARWATVFQEKPRGTGDALRACQSSLDSDRFLVVNGDDLYAAADLDALARHRAGVLVHPVDEPRRFGIVFPRADGTLERLMEKPNLEGRQLANIGAYVFPREVFDIDLQLSPRGEYEITDYLAILATRKPVQVVTSRYWLPIGTVEAWQKAQTEDLAQLLKR